MDAEAFKRLYPTQYLDRYLDSSVRPDGRPLGRSRPTSVSLNSVSTADGSALVKIGNTTMLAGIKLEVIPPLAESPDQGCLTVEFAMPPICSANVRPGRPAEEASVISQQLTNALTSSGLINLKELSISSGKAAWMLYLDVYCLDADGSLLDAALLASVAAIVHLQIPAVSVAEEGRVVTTLITGNEKKNEKDVIESRKLNLGPIPFALTVAMNKKHLVADPTSEEETILGSSMNVVMDSSDRIICLYKAGGCRLASTSTFQDCVALARRRRKEMHQLLNDAT